MISETSLEYSMRSFGKGQKSRGAFDGIEDVSACGLMLRRFHDAICAPSPFILSCEAMWLNDKMSPSENCVKSP